MKFKIVFAFATIYVVWGSTYLGIQYAIQTIPPLMMISTRFLVAGAILYAFCRWRGMPAPTGREWKASFFLGSLMMLGGTGGVSVAEQTVPSGLTALLICITPLWIALIERVRPNGRRTTRLEMIGIVIGLGGVAMLVGQDGLPIGSHVDFFGAGLVLASSFCWSLGTVLSKGASTPSSPFMATAAQMLAGGVALAAASLLRGEANDLHLEAISIESVVALIYLIVPGSLLAFSAYIWLIRVVPPSKVATYAYVNPVIALLLGWAMAGEHLSLMSILAALVIVGAVVMVVSMKKK
ncbi:MAG: EamA family transporter [Planctomycetaceae bacterium]|nr:EamA family transporter [Planctomycetaceae bacterium]